MQIYGIDFTSAPSKRKPITCAQGMFDGNTLTITALKHFYNFQAFEEWLKRSGPWVAAMDFPFSQPLRWVNNMGWPTVWDAYVALIEKMTLTEFTDCIKTYRNQQPAGEKYHLRPIDRVAKACSPMMIDYTPVGRMFYQGAKRLLQSDASIVPFIHRNPDKIVVEGYPAMIARMFCGKQGYKSDDKIRQQCEKRRQARLDMIAGLTSETLQQRYGFQLHLPWAILQQLETPDGDNLDAVLCAIQAAWAFTKRAQDYGIPNTSEALEGWIADPGFIIRPDPSSGEQK